MRKAYSIVGALLVVLPLARAQKTAFNSRGQSITSKHTASISRPSDKLLQDLDQRLRAIDDREAGTKASVEHIEKRVDEPKKLSLIDLAPTLIAALAGIAGVLLGAFAGNKQQEQRLAQEAALAQIKADNDLRLAERQSRTNISSAVVDWQLKQLFLLYGPLRALLGQSFGLYRQMNAALSKAAPNKFRLVRSPGPGEHASEDGQEFQVLHSDGDWTRFRVVMHMQHVYGQGFDVELYLDEIVAIGSRVVTIIQENAGYARPEEADIMNVFARYLAHFAVMDHQHTLAKALQSEVNISSQPADLRSNSKSLLNVDLSAVFPLELPSLIDSGFSAITHDIEAWKRKTI